jgi:hypothetical protein
MAMAALSLRLFPPLEKLEFHPKAGHKVVNCEN